MNAQNEYFLFLVLIFVVSTFLYFNNENSRIKEVFVISSLIIFCGFRPLEVGSDSKMYAKMLDYSTGVNTHSDLPLPLQSSITFFVLLKICATLFGNYTFLFFVISLCCNIILYKCICKLVPRENIFSTLYLYFFSFFYFTFFINGIRNGLSYVLLLYALALFRERKYLYVCTLIILSATIHISSLIVFICFIGYYYIPKLQISIFLWIFSVTLAIFGIDLFNLILGILFETDIDLIIHKLSFYDSYNLYKTGIRIDFIIFGGVWGIIFLYRSRYEDLFYKSLLAAYLTLNGLQFLFFSMPFNDRIGILSWFLIPILLNYNRNSKTILIMKALISLLSLFNLYFIYKYNFDASNL